MIRKQDVRDVYPLSPMQEGMLFRWLYDRDSTAYFEQLSFRVADEFDRAAFDAACRELFRRHDVLRTVFVHENVARPLQVVRKDAPPEVRFADLRHLTAREQHTHLEEWKTADRLAGFDLTAMPPVRIALFRLTDVCHEVVWSHHHILMDGWCLGILHGELVELYGAFAAGRVAEMPPARPFGAYIRWIEAQDAAAAKHFWAETLAGYEELTTLPRGAASRGMYDLAERDVILDDAEAALLRRRAAEAQVTASTLLHAVWGILLGKYNDTRDAVFGSVISNRPEAIAGIETMVGLFINSVPVRIAWDSGTTFRVLLGTLHEHLMRRRLHEFLPLAEIQAAGPLGGELFDHLMLVQNYPVEQQFAAAPGSELHVEGVELFEHTHYPFTVSVTLGAGVRIRFSYDRASFADAQIAALEEHLRHLLSALLHDVDAPIATVPLTAQVVDPVPPELPAERTVVELFEDAVQKHPHRVAVSCGERSLTYEQLDHLANGLAHELVGRFGIQPDDRVALLADRSELTVAAMLGIIKAGGAYVAIDPSFPPERIRYVLDDSGSRVAVAAGAATDALPSIDMRAVAPRPVGPPSYAAPHNLLYVAYTSGSTGRPKGVMIEHRNVAAFVRNLPEVFGLAESDRILALTAFTFDISVLELLCSLAQGLHLVVASDEVAADPRLILDEIELRGITVLQVTPSRLSTLIDAGGWESLTRLRVLLVGGEAMPPDIFEGLRDLRGTAAFNVYGPTETTIWSTALRIGVGPLSVGVPLPGESVLILSRDGHVAPPGVAGEICIGGNGLGRGYLNRDDLTRERYIAHPLQPGRRLYCTGDIGRQQADGRLEVLGRRDEQVKVRGFRVELGEIEAALRECEGVRHAAVIVRDRDLVAYAVAGDGISADDIRAAAGRKLPAYMIPPRIVLLDRMPLLPSGKADRKALPAPADAPATSIAVGPRDAIERALLAIWSSVLGRDAIGVFDNFFEIGGHSLKATQILGRLRRDLHVDLRMRDLFGAPTIATLAALVRGRAPSAFEPIEAVPPAESYELSHAQRRMWVLHRMSSDPAQYVMPAALTFDGVLDAAALQRGLDALAARHESLRTIFPLSGDEPRQVVLPPSAFPLEHIDLSSEPDPEERARAIVLDAAATNFDLEHGPLARACLLRIAPQRHVFVFCTHHIISDGWSLGVLVRDLSRLYAETPLKPLPLQTRDFAAWQNRLLTGEAGEAALQYWRDKLAGDIEALELPLDHPRPPLSDPRGSSVMCRFTRAQCNGLIRIARERGATLLMAATALVKVLLHRYTGAEDIVVGMPIAGRNHPDLRDQVGVFLNTLALRDHIHGDAPFGDVLDSVRRTMLDAFDHQLYPFDLLVEKLGVRRDPSRTPLFDVLVAMQNEDSGQLRLGDVGISSFDFESPLTRFDLGFSFADADGLLSLRIDFRTALFRRSRIERMAAHLSALVSAVIADSARPIDAIELATEREATLLLSFNDTRREIPEKTIIDLFDEQAARTPERIAVVCDGGELTYAELRRESERVAAHLEVRPDERVGLLIERSADAIVAMFGILRAGAAYVPLDPDYPDQRIAELIADSDCRAVLTTARWLDRAHALGNVPALDVRALPAVSQPLPRPEMTSRNLAYVLFTSGTTGRPKGAMIEHRSVVNLAAFLDRDLQSGIGDGLRESALASLMFDVSVQEVFGALLRGNTLHILGDALKRDPRQLGDYLIRHRIQVLSTTPGLLTALLEAGVPIEEWSVEQILIGAEVLPKALMDRLFARTRRPLRMCNLYGPTECCVDSTFLTIVPGAYDRDVSVPIGGPLPNVRIYICDASLRLVPIGIVGEICIGGAGLARGYLNRDELTACTFVEAPFDVPFDGGGRIYRTGDLGCWREDGTIQFVGRRDQQVKVRGYRVELGEIEHHLAAIDGIGAVAVDAREGTDGSKDLVAYFVASEPRGVCAVGRASKRPYVPEAMPTSAAGRAGLDRAALRRELAGTLPPFMVPSWFVQVDALPMTSNGKLDRRMLPDPHALGEDGDVRAAAPADEIESAMLGIWLEVLGLDRVGLHDDFFELGGHSLKAIRVTTRIREQLGCEISIADFFAGPTISRLAALARAQIPSAPARVEPAPSAPHYPLSHAQRRLWVLAQMDEKAASYNISVAFELEGSLDIDALEGAFVDVITRHESLRTIFPLIDGTPRQIIRDSLPFALARARAPLAEAQAAAAREAHRPFDLAHGPLVRAALWSVSDARHLLVLTLHHIIADGWSLDVLVSELGASYEARREGRANPLPPLPLQAKDFAWWEVEGDDPRRNVDRRYWLDKLGGELLPLDLPSDFPRPPVKSYRGRTAGYDLGEPTARALEQLGREHGATLYAVLVALVKVLLHRYSGQEDVTVGSAAAGRGRTELENQVGFYVDTFALRDEVRSDAALGALLRRVNRTVEEALGHLRYPFDLLVGELNPRRDTSRSPLFDVMLLFGRSEPIAMELEGLRVSPASVASDVSKFDLSFHFDRNAGGIGAAIEYNADLFTSARIERMIAHIRTLASSIVERGPSTTIGELDVMSDAERELVVRDFNQPPTAVALPSRTIDAQFAVQVEAAPDRPAVISDGDTWTYGELDRHVEQVAQSLLGPEVGLCAGEPVLVHLDRSPRAIAALLGVLRAGGVYVPADPQCPPLRLEEMLRESDCRIIIGDRGVEVLPGIEPRSYGPDAAYLIFTSGSTGKPKGVLLEHRGFVNMALRQIETFGVTCDDRVLQFASPAFDASMSEIFMALFAGAALVLVGRDTIVDGARFLDHMERFSVSVATLPPSYLNALGLPLLRALKVLITAGEPPVLDDVRFYAPRLRYFNAYGPTESSVCATIHQVDGSSAPTEVPIGRPLANTSIYVLDAALRPVPIGVPGEICIGGIGLARGYLGDAEQTARCFVTLNGERLYRTGDRGWWRSDGQLIYAGRLDEQVKILGHRIEPAEVVRALESCPGVVMAFVTTRGDSSSNRELLAYLQRDPGLRDIPISTIREELLRLLPPAMIPAHLIWVEAFPRTINGKIDKSALPPPEDVERNRATGDDLPANAIEAELVSVWQQVLRVPHVGTHDHFFELGGDSIKLLQIAAELRKRGLRVEITDVYRHPTIAALAARVQSCTDDAQQGPITGLAPLSATQAWFFSTWKGDVNHFNQSLLLHARERIEDQTLREALHAIVGHHDALRTRFRREGGVMRQEFLPAPAGDVLDVIDLRGCDDEEVSMEREANRLQRSLDLASGRVFAAALFRGRERDALFLVAHHLVVDGVSWRIALQDLSTAFALVRAGQPVRLPSKTQSFKHWAEQQHLALQHESLQREAAYWQEVVSRAPAGEAGQASAERHTEHIALSASDTRSLLTTVHRAFGVRTDAILLTALARAFARCGDPLPLVILEGHGREEIVERMDVTRTIGWFTSMYPLRVDLGNSDDLEEQAASVARSLAAVPNRGVGYGIAAWLGNPDTPLVLHRELPGAIAFNYLGEVDAAGDDPLFEAAVSNAGDPIDPQPPKLHAIDLLARVAGGVFTADLGYDPQRYPPAKARALAAQFEMELREIVRAPVKAPGDARDAILPIARVRPYGVQRVAGVPLLLNRDRERKLFAMPPLFGYGAAFRSLATHIHDCAFLSFDFIEDDDRIEQYARGILAHGSRSSVLLGYSGGGNLAFEVAKELERRGHTVTDLVLFDAPLRRRPIVMSDDEVRTMMEGNLGYFRKRMEDDPEYRVLLTDPQMKQVMLRKMESFIRYLNGLVNRGAIASPIHLIRSAQQWADPEDWDEWSARTTAGMRRYRGFGDHADMTDDEHMAANAAIVNRILARPRGVDPLPAVPQLADAVRGEIA